MKMVNGLARLPELSKGMQELSMEMTKVIKSLIYFTKKVNFKIFSNIL